MVKVWVIDLIFVLLVILDLFDASHLQVAFVTWKRLKQFVSHQRHLVEHLLSSLEKYSHLEIKKAKYIACSNIKENCELK